MVAGVWSDEGNMQLEATTQFRKLLSIGKYCLNIEYCCVCIWIVCDLKTFLLQSVVPRLKKLYSRELFLAL